MDMRREQRRRRNPSLGTSIVRRPGRTRRRARFRTLARMGLGIAAVILVAVVMLYLLQLTEPHYPHPSPHQ